MRFGAPAPEQIVPIRREESVRAARMLGATYHESLVDDLEVYYTDNLIRRLAAVIRRVRPGCLLLPSPIDYMEDHQNTARVGATAAFCRGIPNYRTIPEIAAIQGDIAVYHAMPYGLAGPLGERIEPEFLVTVSGREAERLALLECHASQRDWLDASQGIGSYTDAMLEMSASVARLAGLEGHAEGWRRRSHLGFCSAEYRPLETILERSVRIQGFLL